MRRRTFLTAMLALPSCGSDDAVAPKDAGAADGATGGTGGVSGDGGGADSAGSGWRTDTPLPDVLQEMTAAAYGDKILVAGGFQGAAIVDRVLLFDPIASVWSDGPPLPARRHHLSLATLDGNVYALGGLEEITFSPKASCFRLDAGASAWTPIAPLPNARGAAAAGAVDGRIVLAGGFGDASALLPLSLVYDPKVDQWELGAPLPSPREHLAGFVHNDQFWTVGGREFSLSTNTNKVEVYDPKTDTWRGAPDLPTPRGGLGASVLDGKAYVIGGETPSAALDVVEVLDLASETWTTGPPVPTRRHGHAQAAVGGRIYVIGGGDEPNFAAVSVVESFAP